MPAAAAAAVTYHAHQHCHGAGGKRICLTAAGAQVPPTAGVWPHHGLCTGGQRGRSAVHGAAGLERAALLWRHHV